MTGSRASSHGKRSGYVLADALAGLGILAAGLAAFLACMAQGHRLMTGARDLRDARAEASWQLSRAAVALPGSTAAVVQPYPGPVQLARSGAALCTITPASTETPKKGREVRTIRFCAPAEGGG